MVGQFSFGQSDANSLTLDGDLGKYKIHARLHLLDDTNKFPFARQSFTG